MSATTMSKSQSELLPAPSAAVQDTLVVPSGKTSPDTAVHDVPAMAQLSVAVGWENETGAAPAEHSTTALGGQLIAGPVESTTVTFAVQESVAPRGSVHASVTPATPRA